MQMASAATNATGPVPGSEQTITGIVVGTASSVCILASDERRIALYGEAPCDTRPGDLVAATCRKDRHSHGGTTFRPLAITVLGHGTAPSPHATTLAALCRGEDNLSLVRVRGIVDDISADEIDAAYRILWLREGSASLSVIVPAKALGSSPDFDKILHAEIEFTGICHPECPTARYYRGPVFLLEGDAPIRVVKPAPPDIFNRPPIPFGKMFSPAEITSLGLRTVTGTVVAVWGGNNALLSQPNGLLTDGSPMESYHRVEFPYGIPPPAAWETVQVVGQPETDTYHINLSRACWRALPARQVPAPDADPIRLKDLVASIGSRTVYNPYAFGRTTQLEGLLTAMPTTASPATRLHLLAEGMDVAVDTGGCPEVLQTLVTGSRLKVTGTCLFDIENWRPNMPRPKIQGFFIVIRSPDDIVTLSRPSWWTPGRLMSLVFALGALLAGALVWNRTLDRLAARRGRALADEQLEHSMSELKATERTRLAVELHDSLSQSLAGVACQVGALKNAVEREPGLVKPRIQAVERILKSTRTELRNCLFDLRSNVLDEPDMALAIRRTLDEAEIDAAVAVRFDVPREILLDSTAHAILSIIRELAGNAVRHGKATRIRVAGSIDNGHLLFSVRDNGCGFDTGDAPGVSEGHFGLDGICNRATRLNGTFTISSARGGGTRAVVDIPLPASFLSETTP